MSASQLSTGVTIINSLKGFSAVSLTEFDTSAATAIASGSVVEVSGAFFQWDADETPSGWSSISTASTAYIAVTPSGTAGSQTLSAAYTSTAPTWRTDNQGWYASAGSNTRYVASVYKTSGTQYDHKSIEVSINQESEIGNFTLSGSLIPRIDPTTGSQSISSSAEYTPPIGFYQAMFSYGYSNVDLFGVQSGSNQVGFSGSYGGPFCGTSTTKISNESSVSATWYYAKF